MLLVSNPRWLSQSQKDLVSCFVLFFSWSFIVLALTLISMIDSELIIVFEKGIHSSFFACVYSIVPAPFVEKTTVFHLTSS